MNNKFAALAVVGASLAALPAFAQTAATPAPAAPVRHGTAVPGLCIFSAEAAVSNSAVGKYVVERMRQLDAPSEAELSTQAQSFQQAVQTYNTQRASLTPEQQAQQEQTLGQRQAQMQQLYQVRARESQVTSQKALERINTELTPLVTQAYVARNCSVLLDASAVMAANPQSDLTQEVVRLLDAKLTQFPFERERIDAAAAGAGTAPAARAGAAPAR